MCKLCDSCKNTQIWIQKKCYVRSKFYDKFYKFIRDEVEDNLEGFLIGILFHSKNRRIKRIKDMIEAHLCDSFFFFWCFTALSCFPTRCDIPNTAKPLQSI